MTQANTVVEALPDHAAGNWCDIAVTLPGHAAWWARVELTDPARGQVVRSQFLGPINRSADGDTRQTLVHVPCGASAMSLAIFGMPAEGAVVRVRPLRRWEATARLLWRGRHLLSLAAAGSFLGLLGRVRAMVGQAPAREGEAPPYEAWIAWCESAMPPPPPAEPPNMQVVIVGGTEAARAATLASLAPQILEAPWPPLMIDEPAAWRRVAAEWILVVGAGEMLAPAALAWFAAAIVAVPAATCITADCDWLGPEGRRTDPLFLPGPDRLLLATGVSVAGPCAVRWNAPPAEIAAEAQSVRLWLAMQAAENLVHVPRVLAHLPSGESPIMPWHKPRSRKPATSKRVAALVPSAARSPHVLTCVRRVACGTDYPNLTIHVLLTAPAAARKSVLRGLQATPRTRTHAVAMQPFNYAAANNRGAALVDSDLLLLLNDDVAPLSPGWLDAMVAHMQDPGVGIVGARLLYGNGMVQHEGVIMGLADLCEHAGRLRPGDDAGPHGIGRLSRGVAAVTAACMLIRASLYRELGGMDEGFAVALNDVDLCLRARQAGAEIVYCAEAELLHYESLSLGRHYEGARAALESVEVRRLRQRWGEIISADPCYNPQASLELGREWQPAFPPRQGGIMLASIASTSSPRASSAGGVAKPPEPP
ncbi:MAG TPA: glycosyltransferase [Acetobacteraceae bacterium]|nr:glycosyltransferase [Acetobacteraceae bacterium]